MAVRDDAARPPSRPSMVLFGEAYPAAGLTADSLVFPVALPTK